MRQGVRSPFFIILIKILIIENYINYTYNYISMAEENLSIKDVVTLFENDLRTEEQLKGYLDVKTKEELIKHILTDITEEDGGEEDGNADSDLEY